MHLYTFFFLYFHISIFRNLTAYILFYKQSYDFKLTRDGFQNYCMENLSVMFSLL